MMEAVCVQCVNVRIPEHERRCLYTALGSSLPGGLYCGHDLALNLSFIPYRGSIPLCFRRGPMTLDNSVAAFHTANQSAS